MALNRSTVKALWPHMWAELKMDPVLENLPVDWHDSDPRQ